MREWIKFFMNPTFYTTTYLLLLISLGYIATDIYLPSLPALSAYFHTSNNEVQKTLSAYLLSFAFTPLIFGPLSDHIGRKKVILGGIIVSILASFGCLFAPSIQFLIAARLLQGIGTGAVLIAARAITSDLFTGAALVKQISITIMLMPLILAIAPTIGGVLQQNFQWQSVFIFLIVYMALIFIYVILQPESLKNPSNSPISKVFSTYRSHLNNKPFLIFGINFVLPSLGLFAYLTTSPFLFQEVIGLSPVEYGNLALYIGGVIIVTGYINLKLTHRFSLIQILYVGSILTLLAGCLLLFFHMKGILTTWSLLLPSLLYFTCMPLCIANAASKAMSLVHGHFGAATALLTTIQFLTGALGSYIFSILSDNTALPLAICFILVGILSFINLRIACKVS